MNYKKCKIWDGGSDLSKQWYVYYSFLNPDTKQYQLFKIYISNKLKLKAQRYEAGRQIMHKYNDLLEKGFNPFYADDRTKTRIIEAMEFLMKIRQARTVKKKKKQNDWYTFKKFTEFLHKKNLQHQKLSDFTKHHAQAFQDWLLTEERLSNRTCNNLLLSMRTYFNELYDREYVTDNMFKRVKKLEIAQATIVALTDDQMDILNKHLEKFDKELWAFTSFIYYACMRTIEITRLQRKHLDLDNEVILIDGEISKTKKQQPVRILPELKYIIETMQYKNLPSEWYLFSNRIKPGINYVVSNTVQGRWRKFVKAHGMDGVHMYYLKHTANGHAVDKGISVRDIQEHNRHYSLDQTQKYLDRFRKMGGSELNKMDGFRSGRPRR
jgi:integrase